jgi:hypothetical protein
MARAESNRRKFDWKKLEALRKKVVEMEMQVATVR